MKEIKSAGADETWRTMAANALQAWNLEPSGVELIARSENIVFRVETSNGCYALRIHRPGYHTREELESEQIWTAALLGAGIDVPIAVPTTPGQYYADIPVPGSQERRHVGLVEWIGGEPLRNRMDQESGEAAFLVHVRQLGQIAARIHNQATRWDIPCDFRRHSFDAEGFMGDNPFWGPFWDLPELEPAERKLILGARKDIYQILAGNGKDSRTWSMIHADLHHGNLMVDGETIYVIDFDDAGFGWHQYELAVALFSLQDHPRFEEIRDALIAGYRLERDISDAALELLPLFLLIRALALLGWIHHRPEIDRGEFLPNLIHLACSQAKELGFG